MPIELKLDAEKRTDLGKGASRRLRRAQKVPAVLYGGKGEAVALTLSVPQVVRLMEEEEFYSQILTLKLEGKAEQVVVKDIQRHPFKAIVNHIDLQRIVAGQLMRSRIPFLITGQEELAKVSTGVLQHDMIDVEIECLPQDMPRHIEVDVSEMEIGDSIHLASLELPEGVTIPQLAQELDHEISVVSLHAARVAADDEDEAEDAEVEAGDAEEEDGESTE